ncbi:MAG: PEGA domain-containing protein [Methanogenium sp.]|nr:PEGA domain-containing protein [Methanogenium sp.]
MQNCRLKKGYIPHSEEIAVVDTNDKIDRAVRTNLQDYSCGRLFINSTPAGAKIYLRGEYTGVSTPYEFDYMPIGTYTTGLLYNRTLFKETSVTVQPYEKSGLTVLEEDLR